MRHLIPFQMSSLLLPQVAVDLASSRKGMFSVLCLSLNQLTKCYTSFLEW